jgi:hypothetical protein
MIQPPAAGKGVIPWEVRGAAGTASICGWVGHFISNLIASWAQPDTGFPPKVMAGR